MPPEEPTAISPGAPPGEAGALPGLRRYVALREDAAPALRPQVDSARMQLARLVGR